MIVLINMYWSFFAVQLIQVFRLARFGYVGVYCIKEPPCYSYEMVYHCQNSSLATWLECEHSSTTSDIAALFVGAIVCPEVWAVVDSTGGASIAVNGLAPF